MAEIRAWLHMLNDDDLIGVDDGGLCLRVVGNDEVYCEIGGSDVDDDEEASD